MNEPVVKVRKTTNYNLFKMLTTNRDVTEERARRIERSIMENGYIPNPIIVNEKLEIIDGQGRFTALRRRGMPIEYIVVDGIGIDECRAMNRNQSNWQTKDYIKSFKDQGVQSYVWLDILLKKYNKLQNGTVMAALNDCVKPHGSAIARGDFHCSETEYAAACVILDFVNEFTDIMAKVPGRKEYFQLALCFAIAHCDKLDEKHMIEAVHKNISKMAPCNSMKSALESISELYNAYYRGKKIYLYSDYQRWRDSKGKEA